MPTFIDEFILFQGVSKCTSPPPRKRFVPLRFGVVMGKKVHALDESRRLCLTIFFRGRSVRGLLEGWRGVNGLLFVLMVDLVLRL
jgi:hypothetical protein